jgi:hypothetical protein
MTTMAGRNVRRRVREAVGELWDELPADEPQARDQQIRQTVHRELLAYNREAVTANDPVLPDPDQVRAQAAGRNVRPGTVATADGGPVGRQHLRRLADTRGQAVVRADRAHRHLLRGRRRGPQPGMSGHEPCH